MKKKEMEKLTGPDGTDLYRCSLCHGYTGTPQQVNLHSYRCAKREAKRGTPPANDSSSIPTTTTTSESPGVETEQEPVRRKRIPFGRRRQSVLPTGDRKYFERVFNDNWDHDPARIQKAIDAGYDRVPGREAHHAGPNKNGSSIKGVLMRIPIELHEEDEAERSRQQKRRDEAIYGAKNDGQIEQSQIVPTVSRTPFGA